VIRIAIAAEAFAAIAATLPLGSVSVEPEPTAKGERFVWLEPACSISSRPFAGLARATAT
jgi:hypothetical protein